ncbi:hypothetical protein XENOCAPTIV_002771 [Xenoophorus captivus]|uniref:C2H2-type domain-containing protein n=1 Tax=Xenoophorus captivus TaxID=1517983 RepID=A0ABV0Q7P8_9TELE
MASSYAPPFEGTGEVKEGFLCPLCLKDLQSFYQLQGHYEEEHSGDDRHVRGQLKSTLSSVASILEEKDDEKIRCCHHCMETLLKRQQKLEEKDHVPDIVKLYEEKLLGLMSLPTKEKYEELKEKRKQEQERRLQQERQETLKRRQEYEKNRPPANGELPQGPRAPRMTKAGGWLPSADSVHTRSELEDPLLQQIENIQSFLRQAREARRTDEVAMLEENLRQLQDEYDQQQTRMAIALSQKLAQEESLQQGELQRLEREGREQWGSTFISTQPSFTWEPSLDISPAGDHQVEEETTAEILTLKTEASPPAVRALSSLTSQEDSPPRLRTLGGHVTPPSGEGQSSASLNPFEEEDSTPTEDDPSNPFFEDIKKEHLEVSNGKKEYNPFGEGADRKEDKQGDTAPSNPFEEEDTDAGNPFMDSAGNSPEASTNPFDGDANDEALPDVDMIEEELLLQQIDNIRAYIFDAKLSGRPDEVELLSENLKELQLTLQEQKKKRH